MITKILLTFLTNGERTVSLAALREAFTISKV